MGQCHSCSCFDSRDRCSDPLLRHQSRPGWVGVADKKFWDYLELLFVPAALAIGVYWLNRAQRERELKAQDAQQNRERKAEEDRRQRELKAQAAQRKRELEIETWRCKRTSIRCRSYCSIKISCCASPKHMTKHE